MHDFPFFLSHHLWLDLRVAMGVSCSLVPSLSLYVKPKPAGNLTDGNDLFVFPLYMSCIGIISPLKDTPSVTVIPLLSLAPFLATCFEFFSAIVTFAVGTYFDGV